MTAAVRVAVLLTLFSFFAFTAPLHPTVPSAAQASSHFNVLEATNAWLATVPPAAKARSDAYFEGTYWLILWDFLYGAAVFVLLLETKLSARMRAIAERVSRFAFLHTVVYWIEFSLAVAVLSFPMTLYEGFFRERQYGLLNQGFSGWFRDLVVALGVDLVFGGLAVAVFVAFVRRQPRTWHIWGTLVGIGFFILGAIIAPVFIAPLFNTYKPLENTAIKREILSLARENGIPANNVYEDDASRQSKRVSANVSGFLGTERITLNDNLLNRCSPEAVLSTMGHEMGHYVLNHVYKAVMFAAIVIFLGLSLLRIGLDWIYVRFASRWSLQSRTDLALIPAAALILSVLGLLFTPISNTFVRTQEYEADIFGLSAARQPDGEAETDLLLGEYRKLDPTPLEEFLFFDHPSGRTRISAAMRWKAENLCLFNPDLPCDTSPSSTK